MSDLLISVVSVDLTFKVQGLPDGVGTIIYKLLLLHPERACDLLAHAWRKHIAVVLHCCLACMVHVKRTLGRFCGRSLARIVLRGLHLLLAGESNMIV